MLAPPAPAAPATGQVEPPASSWRYHASVDAALETLSVTVCFEGSASSALIPGQPSAYEIMREPQLVDEGGAVLQDLVVDKRGIVVPAGAVDPCVRYRVAAGEGARSWGDRSAARRVGDDLVVAHDVWLWRPARYVAEPSMRARIDAPPPLAVSTPWPRAPDDEGAFVVPRSTLKRLGYVAFGRFTVRDVEVPGGTLHVAVLDGQLDGGHALVIDWLARAGRAVAQLYGRFPRRETQVIVSPSASGTAPLFGWVVRGGGPSVNLLVGRWASADSLDLDVEWVAVHEMSHLSIPHVELGEPWLSEGLATWYQNVLRARAGELDERDAWALLLDGFERGRASLTGETLLDDSEAMYRTGSFWRVYWAGTALVMLADVEIRRASQGRSSLDAALLGLLEQLDSDVTMTALELCRAIDERSGVPGALARIAERGRRDRRFPDVEGVLRGLGVLDARGRLALDDTAPLAELRRQIMTQKEVAP